MGQRGDDECLGARDTFQVAAFSAADVWVFGSADEPALGPDLVSSMAAAPGTGAAWVAAYSQRPGATPGQIFSNGR